MSINQLKNLLKELPEQPEKMEELIKLMNSKEVRLDINLFLSKCHNDEKLTTDETNELHDLIRAALFIYTETGESTGMTDSEYDILYEKLQQEGLDMEISMPVVGNGEKENHKYISLRGTLDKIYAVTADEELQNPSRISLDDWINSSERKIKSKTDKDINLKEQDIYAFPKFDGVSIEFEFSSKGELQRALTRGNTKTNEAKNVTHIFKGWFKGPYDNYPTEYGLKTECMMTDEDLAIYNKTYNTTYKQTRSIVSSIINSKEVDERVNFLRIIPLRISSLDKDGNEMLQTLAPGVFDYPFITCKLGDGEKIKEFGAKHTYVKVKNSDKDTHNLRCDGVVLYIIDEEIQKILGRENNKQKFEVAYKFNEEIAYTKIKGIEFTTGLFGSINPVAQLEPIKMKGNTISSVDLGSIRRFNTLHLAVGDTVRISYEIIPYLYMDSDPKCVRSGNEPIPLPTVCSDCGSPLEQGVTDATLYCRNPECPCNIKGRILNYFRKLNIDGISYETINDFYNYGYLKSIKDIYKLRKHEKELKEIPGYGEKSINEILKSIYSHTTVTESEMLGAIGIESIGQLRFKSILNVITYDELIELCLEEDETKALAVLCTFPGIKTITATKVIKGIKSNIKLIQYLEDKLDLIKDEKPQSSLFNVYFTKVSNEELEKFTQDKGGSVSDRFNKDIDILVVPMLGIESAKVPKAEKWGIPVVPVAEYKKYVEDNILRNRR